MCYGYTIDYIYWECPECGHENDSSDNDCSICEECGFEKEFDPNNKIGDTDSFDVIYSYETEEDE